MAKTYEEIQNEIARLQQEAAAIRANELNAVIQEIRAKMTAYGISVDQLKESKGVRKPAAVQFRNSATGDAWTGRGRTPRWLADAESKGQNRESFRVK